jgi:hypothetical protein
MSNKFFTFSHFTLLVALCISAIAAYYSVIGLTAIFAGAVVSIIVMGTILEIAKITTTVWLHRYWNRAQWTIKTYLTIAVIALAFLTSMGIFGFLSKSHSDTGLVGGDVTAQLAFIDEKIKTQRDNIDIARRAIQQMDDQVNQRLSRSDSEQGAERAVQIRRQQAAERAKLQKDIGDAQIVISKLNEERTPIAASQRKVEAEVGPIKYIASVIYGDNPDANLLERAVRWVTILIVLVFDPLAIILILASTTSIKWDQETSVDQENSSPVLIVQEQSIPDSYSTQLPPIDVTAEEKEMAASGETVQYKSAINDEIPDATPDFTQGSYKHTYTILQPKFVFDLPTPNNDSDGHLPETTTVPSTVESASANLDIETNGVTTPVELYSNQDEYVTYEGKKIKVDALKQLRPDLIVNGPIQNNILFGSKFPTSAKTGDIHTRIDVMPNRTYKFNGVKWIQINREENTTYLLNTAYIQYLISKIDSGEYDPGLLTEHEQEEISEYLKRTT